MTDPRVSHVRSAVVEIVNQSPLAPPSTSLHDARAATAGNGRRPALSILVTVVLVAFAVVGSSVRLGGDRGSPSARGSDLTDTNVTRTVTVKEAIWVMQVSEAAFANMDALAGPLIQQCMAAKGFTFTPQSDAITLAQNETSFLRRRYQSPLQAAGRWGYAFEAGDGAANEPMEVTSPDANKPGFAEALIGDVISSVDTGNAPAPAANRNALRDGCAGQAYSALLGSPTAYLDVLDTVNGIEVAAGRSLADLRTDEEFVRRNQGWVACMSDGGFVYPSLTAIWEVQWPSPRPSAAETRAAGQDAECRSLNRLDDQSLLLLEHRWLQAALDAQPIIVDDRFERAITALLAGKAPSGSPTV